MSLFETRAEANSTNQISVTPQDSSVENIPAVGITPPQILAQEAAEGRRGAAWRLLYQVMENDPRAIEAIAELPDDRLVQNLLECIALGTWAGKKFELPANLRTPLARTHLRTLFMLPAGIMATRSERVALATLQDKRIAVRETSMHILGLLGSQTAIPALIAALQDSSQSTRLEAIKALGKIHSPQAVSALLGALNGADEQQGSQIYLALVNQGGLAVPALIAGSQSKSTWTRWHAIRALGEIGDQQCMLSLVNGLNDADHAVAWMAAKGLVRYGVENVKPVLQLLINHQSTPWLVETTSYVLSQQSQAHTGLKPYLDPVIKQMHEPAFRAVTGMAAQKALDELESSSMW